MAILRVNVFSETLVRNINLMCILPIDARTIDGDRPWRKGDSPMKSLYLLHGIHGCELDWLTGSRIKRWAMEKKLAVFMPAGENKFYNHLDPTHDWFDQFIGQELVEITRSMFPLSEKREDTYIAGLSMGGYGSLCAGLRYPETFSRIGAFSSALIDRYPADDNCIGVVGRRSQMVSCLGEEDALPGSSNNVYHLIDQLTQKEVQLPEIYMAVGDQDPLRAANQRFYHYLKECGCPAEFFETPGGHEWTFWDTHIERFLNWLPV